MGRTGRHLFTSESVTEGHPDKIADQISDGVLDAIIAKDPVARVACETLVTTGLAVIAGEITTNCNIDYQRVVRDVIADVGYTRAKFGFDAETCSVLSAIHEQSRDIGQGVDTGGAGDQGLMFGYACRETTELMPLPIMLAHKLVRGLSETRRKGELDYLRPDGKSQVTVEYNGARPVRIDAVVLSTQHSDKVSHDTITRDLTEQHHQAARARRDDGQEHEDLRESDGPLRDRRTARRFRRHRPQDHRGHVRRRGPARRRRVLRQRSDEGRSVRLLHGALHREERRRGGTRGSRDGAARLRDWRRRSGLGARGHAKAPAASPTTRSSTSSARTSSLTPRGIIDSLQLRRPIYRKTAAFGHFGRSEPEFTWERTDKAAALASDAGKAARVEEQPEGVTRR